MSHQTLDQMNHDQTSDYSDRALTCVDCGDDFTWTAGEQGFFHDKGLKNEPKRCKPCKQAKNDRLAAISFAQAAGAKQQIEVTVMCANAVNKLRCRFILPRDGRFIVGPASSLPARCRQVPNVPDGTGRW